MPEVTVESAEVLVPGPGEPAAEGQPHWRATLAAAWVAQLLAITGFSFVMPFIPFYLRDLGVRSDKLVALWAGAIVTASGLSMTLFAPFWGVIADRYGRKAMVQRAMFAGAVILSLMGLAGNVYHLLILRILQGVFTGTVSASVALVSGVTPQRRLGSSLGLMQAAVFLGSAAGPWLGGVCADHFGYRLPFPLAGLLLAMAGILVLFMVREDFRRPAVRAQAGSLRQVLLLPGFAGVLALVLMVNFASTVVAPVFPLFVEQIMQSRSRVATVTGLILAVGGLVAGVASMALGRLSDRIGHGRMLVGCTAVSGVLSGLLAAATNIGQLFILRVGFGLSSGGTGPAMNALIARSVPNSSYGRAYGLTASASSLGWALGPMLGGAVASAYGVRAPFVATAVLLIAVSAVAAAGKALPQDDTAARTLVRCKRC